MLFFFSFGLLLHIFLLVVAADNQVYSVSANAYVPGQPSSSNGTFHYPCLNFGIRAGSFCQFSLCINLQSFTVFFWGYILNLDVIHTYFVGNAPKPIFKHIPKVLLIFILSS